MPSGGNLVELRTYKNNFASKHADLITVALFGDNTA